MYAGDIIDGISVDGELFGTRSGYSVEIQTDECVTGLTFGYHTHRSGMIVIITIQDSFLDKFICIGYFWIHNHSFL